MSLRLALVNFALLSFVHPDEHAAGNGVPELKIATYNLDNTPLYETLSYTRGPAESVAAGHHVVNDLQPILLHGYACQVQANLFDFLGEAERSYNYHLIIQTQISLATMELTLKLP